MSPPKQPVQRSTVAATAICGSSTGAKPMNQVWFRLASTSISAVPVLPANVLPATERLEAVPSSATLVIISASWAADSSLITSLCSSGSSSSAVRPSGSLISWTSVGRISVPSLATVAATSAICSGRRQQLTLLAALPDRDAGDVEALVDQLALRVVDAARGLLVVGELDLGVAEEAEALHVLEQRLRAERLADLRPVGVDRVGQRVSHADRRRTDSPPAFASSTPLKTCGEEASSVVSGVNSPESSAAAAVTTFIVEPGG